MLFRSIEQYLKAKGFSRQNITLLKKMHESVLLNDAWSYCNQRVKFSDKLVIKIKEETGSANVVPVSLPLTIIYEDEDILVINKSSNMPIHPSIHNYENTLANAVAYYYECQSIPYTFRCINRLDRDTSGLTILAKHMVSANILGQFMKDRKIKREYLCIVDGKLEGNGTINAPIGRVDGSTIERKIDYPNGEHAITHYETLSSCSRLSFLNVWLDTGRTQIGRASCRERVYVLV